MELFEEKAFLEIEDVRLECLTIGAGPRPPEIVMLHEGLGSVGLWRDFPRRLAETTGVTVFAYSRHGYGRSSRVTLPRPLDYMQREATDVLPRVLDAVGFERGLLLGHSDGASIAAFYAGTLQDHRLQGLVLIAPHFFVEPAGVEEIDRIRERWDTSDLRDRLARHHADVDGAFLGWNEAWRDSAFPAVFDIRDSLQYIRVPVLIIQGDADPYGSLSQVEVAREECMCPVEELILPGGGHAPQFERPEETLNAIAEFALHVLNADPAGAARYDARMETRRG